MEPRSSPQRLDSQERIESNVHQSGARPPREIALKAKSMSDLQQAHVKLFASSLAGSDRIAMVKRRFGDERSAGGLLDKRRPRLSKR